MTTPIKFIDVQTRPIKWLVDGVKTGQISVDNSFQRRYVWVTKDKVALIETILLGFPIPEIYLWQKETNPSDGNTSYSIVDGQQRLGAVHAFINDEFKLLRSALENKDASYAGKVFSELEDDAKSDIWKYLFSVRFIEESLAKEKIVKLFLRLNSTNATLNPQELRNAEFGGLFIMLAEEISRDDFWKVYDVFSASDYRRMLDIQFISTLLLFVRRGVEEETTQAAINRAYDQYNENYPESDVDREVIISTLHFLHQIINGRPYLIDIVRRKTHLYTLFIYAYYLMNMSIDMSSIGRVSSLLDAWFRCYETELEFGVVEHDALLAEYKVLSQEGVQKKTNRLRRFDILKQYVGI